MIDRLVERLKLVEGLTYPDKQALIHLVDHLEELNPTCRGAVAEVLKGLGKQSGTASRASASRSEA